MSTASLVVPRTCMRLMLHERIDGLPQPEPQARTSTHAARFIHYGISTLTLTLQDFGNRIEPPEVGDNCTR